MGQAKSLGGLAVDEFTAYRLTVLEVLRDTQASTAQLNRVRSAERRAEEPIHLMRHRLDLIGALTKDVQSPRTVDRLCAVNGIRPRAFDMGPEAA